MYTHQLNAYFGIHYAHDYIDDVLSVARGNAYYHKLDKDAELKVGKFHLLASTNSDKPDTATRGMIFVDEMTISSADMESAEHTFIALEPSIMVAKEAKCRVAVDAITDLYDLIVRNFKNKKIPLHLHIGWMVTNCAWESESASSGDSQSEISSSGSFSEDSTF